MIGKIVIVYDRYLFAVPVKGVVTAVSEKDGAFQVTFFKDNPGGQNVVKHNGSYFHYQQCKVIEEESISLKLATEKELVHELYKRFVKEEGGGN